MKNYIQPKLRLKKTGKYAKVEYKGCIDRTVISQQKISPPDKAIYTYKRSKQKIIGVARIFNDIAMLLKDTHKVYMFTLTFANIYSEKKRNEKKREFLNNFKHYTNYYFWVTERHQSGKVHFHIIALLNKKSRDFFFGNFKKNIIKWSWKYCGSPNGLDVTDNEANPFYLTKYLTKDIEKLKSTSQLWGYRGLKPLKIKKTAIKYCQPYMFNENGKIYLEKASYLHALNALDFDLKNVVYFIRFRPFVLKNCLY